MLCLKLFVALILLGVSSKAVIRKWKFTNNILDPQNWVGEKPSENCKGVIFPMNLGTVGSVSQLYADEIVLPFSGEIEIKDGGFIEIAENSPCLRIKELQFHYWFSPDSWESTNNVAVPDVERVPCMEDDVVFPTDDTVAVYYPELPVQVHSLQIGGVNMTNEEWQHFLQTDFGDSQFLTVDDFGTTGIKIQPVMCLSPGGCLCHGVDDILLWVCEKVAEKQALCFDPVTPIGNCNEICGAIIHLSVTDALVLDDLLSKVPKYEKVDVHASKVLQSDNVILQMVFIDKQDYSELSTNAAYDFHKQILQDLSSLEIISATLYKSGMKLPEGSSWLFIVVGTLLGSCILFSVLYVLYMGSLQNYNIVSRLPVREISFKNIRPLWFSKFENRDDGRMSMSTSIISLDKAFDNPLYDAHRPSTSSAPIDVADLEASTSNTTHENPIYSEEQHIEVLDIIEEGESSSSD